MVKFQFSLILIIAILGLLDPSAHQVAAQVPTQNAPTQGTNLPTNTNGNTLNNSTLQAGAAQNNNQSQPAQNSTTTTNNTTLTNNNNNTITNANSTSSRNSSSILNKDEAVPLDTKITVPFSILGALLIISGAPMGFWGGRNRWSSYFLTGAYIGALLVMTPILRFGVMDQDHSPSNAIQGVFVLACFISAVGAGAVAVIFWKGTRFLVGGGGGFVLSLFILSLKSNSLIAAAGLRWIVILAAFSIGFVLATIPTLTIHVTLFATAAMGAAAVVLGIDCFTTGGLKEFWLYIIGFGGMFPRLTHFPFTVTMQAELGVMGGLFIMGAAVQWRLLEVIRKKIDELKQLDRDRQMQEDAAAYRQSMAMDADLALWEKRHGDDGDSATMAASPKKFHSRKSSQFSLLPRQSGSPMSPQTPLGTFDTANGNAHRASHDHLLSIDTGGGLAGSLGITEGLPSTNPNEQQPDSHGEAAETILPLYNTPQKSSSERHSSQADRMVSIDFEKFENDRRVSRPPGAPASWSSPLSGSKLMLPGLSGSTANSKPPSPGASSSRPMSYSPRFLDQELRPTHIRSTTEQPSVRSMSEHLSPLLTRRSEDVSRAKARPPSRVIVGSYPSPSTRAPPAQNRESRVMTIEELDQRHKSAMKKLQHPTTEKITAGKTPVHTQTIQHSRSSSHLNPGTHASVNKDREHTRMSSFVSPTSRPIQHEDSEMPRSRLISASSTNQTFYPAVSSPNTPQDKPSKTNAWLSYYYVMSS
ncbi:hypothetical protein PSHT_09329 [Puccinia striiformis]|uniref:TM7S3/TM198-like domain-containing protein n=3 Tax=Puccinia striiformis TaxID=27350 RepID=A0A2S4VHH0_9BASI|nr:hypothetical protein PSHT_09329 [Puccinia striiformis]